jgi:hypothetical protein
MPALSTADGGPWGPSHGDITAESAAHRTFTTIIRENIYVTVLTTRVVPDSNLGPQTDYND